MILAAGFGTRLRPLTDTTPKPLVPVAGFPMIAYPLTLLRAAGITEVVINLHHLGAQIRSALGDGSRYGVSIEYSEEDPILDTGGAIKKARPFLDGGTFLVLNSDMICDLDLREAIAHHRARAAIATMVLRPDPRADSYGIIEIDAETRIRRFLGKPDQVDVPLTPLMFTGIHVFEPAVFDYMAEGHFSITRQTYPAMLEKDCRLCGYVFRGYWRVVDTHAGLEAGRHEVERGNVLAPRHDPRNWP